MNFEQFYNEAMKQSTEEQRTIKCVLTLKNEDDFQQEVRFFSLTPSQYNLLKYLSDDEVNFYYSEVILLNEGSFEKI